jgi:predicted MFS family arabinose efflux permease
MSSPGSSTSAPAAIETPPGHPFSWRFTTPLFIGSALNPINSSLIATALVPIAHGLGVSIGQTAALVTALYLASAIAQPTAGKAAEVFGPRRVFLAGIGLVLVGLPLGGVLVGLLGWRAVFFVNVPVALAALAATLAWVSPDGPLDRSRSARDIAARLDAVGIAGFTAAMIALLLFLFGLPALHWYLLAISLALWIALVLWELRARMPFLDFRLLASNRALTGTYLRFGLVLLCVYVVLYGITQWVETVRGLSESEAGLLLLPMTLVSGLVISPISRRNLVRGPVIVAALTCLIGSAGVLLLSATGWIGWVVVVTLVFGVAMGAAAAGNQTAVYRQAPAEILGTASGLMRTFGYLGSIAASAITGVVFHASVSDHGVHLIAWIMVGVSVVVVLMTVTDRTLRARPPVG